MTTEKKAKVLIADDERNTREAMARFLRGRYEIDCADDGEQAIAMLRKNDYDLVLTDFRMPGVDGMGVLEAALSKANVPECVVFTAYGSVEKAVEAVKNGAFDFITKPVKLDKLLSVVEAALAAHCSKKTPAAAEAAARPAPAVPGGVLLGESDSMKKIAGLIRKVAPSRSAVLITGESGTGKEVVARSLHNQSGRKGLFVAVHCAALPENLLESELFGHEKGAFTGAVAARRGRFELADGGTIFLDEIGEIPPSIQVKLLRVLETRSFERVGSDETIQCDFRLVAATNRDLKKMVEENTFREDLYCRLNVLELHLPPLRERVGDIPALANHFLAESAAENQVPVPALTEEAMASILHYRWPGNIRELKNCMERLCVLSGGAAIRKEDLPEALTSASAGDAAAPETGGDSARTGLDLGSGERVLIEKALAACGNNRTKAAEVLGISRRTLQRKLKQYQLES